MAENTAKRIAILAQPGAAGLCSVCVCFLKPVQASVTLRTYSVRRRHPGRDVVLSGNRLVRHRKRVSIDDRLLLSLLRAIGVLRATWELRGTNRHRRQVVWYSYPQTTYLLPEKRDRAQTRPKPFNDGGLRPGTWTGSLKGSIRLFCVCRESPVVRSSVLSWERGCQFSLDSVVDDF